jgi:HEAT repeat protein/beta-lactamase regulating signal transducer with metallopeptidase domain
MPDLLQTSAGWLPLIDGLTKATLLLAMAALVAALLRTASAASRHLVWTCALLAALALPLLSLALPRWQLAVVTFESPASGMPPLEDGLAPGPIAPTAGHERASAPPADANLGDRPGASRSVPLNFSWLTLLAVTWAAGALAILGRLIAGLFAVRWMARRTVPATGAPWLPLARTLASDLGVARVTFRRSAHSSMPMTWGILRPVVVLPAAADGWPNERVRIALLHELAHVTRADCLTHMLAQVACALYWMNPLAWLAARRARAERERACDDIVLASGTPGTEYADELLHLARAARSEMFSPTAAASLAMARRSHLEGRLMAILDPSVPRTGVSRIRTATVTAVALLALGPLASMQPWAFAEAAVIPPAPIVRPRVDTPAVRTPVSDLAAQQPQAVDAQAPDGKAAQTVPQGTAQSIAQAVGEAIADAVPGALADGIAGALSQNPMPNPNPNPNPNQNPNPGGKSKADPKVVAALTEALKDSDKEVRESAMHALVGLRDPGIFEPLVQALKDASPDVRERAAHGLGQLRDKRAVTPLMSALKDTSASVREQVVFALGQLRDPAAVDGLIAALRDESASVRQQATFALGQIRDERAIEPLLSVLKDSSGDVREQAVFALGQLRARAAVDPLIGALKDADADVRQQAAFALGQLRDPRAIDALTLALKDEIADVRRQAAFALGQLAR